MGKLMRRLSNVWPPVFIGALLVIVSFPLVWMVMSSLRAPEDLLAAPPRLFTAPSLHWYVEVLAKTDALRWFLNSAVIALGTGALNMVFGSLGAFGLTRFRFRGRSVVMMASIAAYVAPPILIFLPLYVTLSAIGVTNTYVGGVIAHTVLTLPFCLWLLQSFFKGIPIEIDESAVIDGASAWQTYRFVVLPLAMQGVLATGILAFMISWSEYLLSSTLLTSTEMKTVPAALGEMSTSAHAPWGEIMVMGILTAAPVLLLFALIQRWFVQGVTAGAVKG